MAAQDPVKYDHTNLTGDNADDGTRFADDGGCPPVTWLSLYTDDLTVGHGKVGKGGQSHGDCHRIEYADKAGVAENDTFDVYVNSLHVITQLEIQPYTDENSVHTTVGIIITITTGQFNTFTVTSAFATECNNASLTDSDAFAIRLQPVAQATGDAQIAEMDADLTASNGNGGRIMSSLAKHGGLAHKGGIAGSGGGLAGRQWIRSPGKRLIIPSYRKAAYGY